MSDSDGFGKLTSEQIQFLFNKMSSDERKEVQETLNKCQSEIMVTRCLPVTALVLASLRYSRMKLPPEKHFGPKGWPFYVIMGVASFIGTNVLFLGKCREQVKPQIMQLWKKYGADPGTRGGTSYDEIRKRHRDGEIQPYQQQPQQRADQHQRRPYRDPKDTAPMSTFGTQLEPPPQSDFSSFRYPEGGGSAVGGPLSEPRQSDFSSYQPYHETHPQTQSNDGFIYGGASAETGFGESSSSDYGPLSDSSHRRGPSLSSSYMSDSYSGPTYISGTPIGPSKDQQTSEPPSKTFMA
ncbi:hypothetical protein WR25_08035 [Diploscapter pachys]|uniref:Uncharacterized protein n=1 Tax=Diploscapter pachys TaxID=2018661 RepID=A0A2A2JDX3_9BILA|nr:hypothetical protein WR25_08035 [Diploscapter pachys]